MTTRRKRGACKRTATLKISDAERELFMKIGETEKRGWSTVMREYAITHAATTLRVNEDDLRRQLREGFVF